MPEGQDDRMERLERQIGTVARVLGLQQTREFKDMGIETGALVKSLQSLGCSSWSTAGCDMTIPCDKDV